MARLEAFALLPLAAWALSWRTAAFLTTAGSRSSRPSTTSTRGYTVAELTDAELDDLMAAIGLVEPRPRGGSKRKPIAHGTTAGYKQHRYRGEMACDACLQAMRDYQREKYRRGTVCLTEQEWQERCIAAQGGADDAR